MNDIDRIYSLFRVHKKICIDSRRIQENAIFFGIKGENFDGNTFAIKALESGCIAAVVDDKSLEGIDNIIYVKDSVQALQQVAKKHREALNIPIIAITGSNGKTTTKELLAAVLARKFRVSYTSGNKNNHIGVPLTLLAMNPTMDIGIVEMGANHIGEIKELCEIALPDYGIITNIGIAHIEGFGSLEGVKKAKSELYQYIEKNRGFIFVNNDNPKLMKLIANPNNTITYGRSEGVYCKGEYAENSFCAGVTWNCAKTNGFAKSNLIGEYNFENILAAITIGNYFGIPPSAIDSAIASYSPRNNRSQLVDGHRNKVILDLYNANPTSMYAAINNFLKLGNGNKCLILGDMLELGDYTFSEHKKLLDYISEKEFRKVYLVGKHFYQLRNYYEFDFFTDVNELANRLIKHPDVGKFFLVKGSRGIKLEKCTDYL